MPTSIEISEVRVPLARLRALNDHQRYTYYLLGFAYNELTFLRKLISFSLEKRNNDMRPVRMNAESSQTLMLFRLACGKFWEAHRKLNSKEIASVLRSDVFPYWVDGPQLLKTMNKSVAKATWLSTLRNTLGFHYPSLDDWKPYITPVDGWVDDVIYAGAEAGNLFYDAADSVARHHMFGYEPAKELRQVTAMVLEMIELLRVMTDFIDEGLGIFVTTHLIDSVSSVQKHKLFAPAYSEQRIPFWMEMSEAKRRKKKSR
jgi:hypothetical protein